MFHRNRFARSAFTLVEAMISISITAIAGSAVLLGVASSLRTTNDVLDDALATGMCQRLMDEISGKLYSSDPSTVYQYPLCPNSYEMGGVCRERYDDIDDFVSCSSQPPCDAWGIALGVDDGQSGARDPNFRCSTSYFANWQQTSSVYYVNPANLGQALPGGSTSDYRAAEVNVYFNDPLRGKKTLATLRRVFVNVPTN